MNLRRNLLIPPVFPEMKPMLLFTSKTRKRARSHCSYDFSGCSILCFINFTVIEVLRAGKCILYYYTFIFVLSKYYDTCSIDVQYCIHNRVFVILIISKKSDALHIHKYNSSLK